MANTKLELELDIKLNLDFNVSVNGNKINLNEFDEAFDGIVEKLEKELLNLLNS